MELSGLDPARLRDEALQHLIHPPERFDLDRAVRDGGPVAVWLGDRELPIGDLGHPRVDARLLLAMLGQGGAQRRRSCASTVSTRPPFVVRSAAHERTPTA